MSGYKNLTITCFILLFSILNAKGPTDEEYPSWDLVAKEIQEKCKAVEIISLPPQTSEVPKGCDGSELYYGFTQAPDYEKALPCAQTNKDYDILTMLYANGKGVSRNLDIAIHYACKFGDAPAELEGRVKHLMELNTPGKLTKDFDICDDITSGYMMGRCAHIASQFEKAKRQKQYTSLMVNWTSEELAGFEKLQIAFETYAKARMGEIDVSGTARASLQITEQNSLKDRFLKTLQECIENKIPPFTSQQYLEADKQLNAIYKKALGTRYFEGSGINREGIKKTQQAWLKYRDAWVTFGRLKCPNISVDNWKTLITKERVKELRSLTKMGNNT